MSKATLIERLKVQALITAPFFATLLLRRPLKEDNTCPTAWTDGTQIGYNPKFFEKLSFKEALTVLYHEILHIAFLHHVRQGARDATKWNYAADYAINLILHDNKFELPQGALLDEKFRGMSAEEIYDLLSEDFQDNPSCFGSCDKHNNGDGKESGNEDGKIKPSPVLIGEVRPKSFASEKEKDAYLNEVKVQVAEAMQAARLRGIVPAGMERIVEMIDKATVNWKEVVASFLTEQYRCDTDFNRPNRRWISQGIFMPSRRSIQRGNFVLAVDTSGSIDQNKLKEFAAEVMAILSLSADKLLILYFDSEVAGTQELEEGDPEVLDAKGGGGTDFAPVIQYLDKEGVDPQVLIYFTDGCCNSFADEPSYPVLWAVDNLEFNPPYGETVVLPNAA